ncbi:MAG: sensor histidine kinase [Firmicutes bacterium]|nr:sensor histidine kinase [Bacillota bacterium]
MVSHLFLALVQEMSVIAVLAFITGRTGPFKNAIERRLTNRDRLVLIVFFGLLSIAGTYTGVRVQVSGTREGWAVANTRAIGAISAGLLGGPAVGLLAGLIGGVHRYSIGGFTGLACGLSTTFEGLLGGLAYLRLRGTDIGGKAGFAIGVAGELAQMAIILAVARPFQEALALVRVIILPMTIVNATGAGMFLAILQSTRAEHEQIEALQANKALRIASRTLPYLRVGLSFESARHVASIIKEVSGVAAVSITDKQKVLAFVGSGSDHHKSGDSVLTRGTREAIAAGTLRVLQNREMIGCPNPRCSLSSGVVVPLVTGTGVIGTVKLYEDGKKRITPVIVELARGVGQLLATQVEISHLQAKAELVTQAELRALQAQINPHFLFNALNTVVSFCRTDPEKARDLLVQLSDFFRRNLRQSHQLVTLGDEVEHVRSYLAIQKARYGDRLNVLLDVDEDCRKALIPPLILQPLVENSIKHGLDGRNSGGTVAVTAARVDGHVVVSIRDDGVGMTPDRRDSLLVGPPCHSDSGAGIGLRNVNDRLKSMFGESCGLKVESQPGRGTTISLMIPERGVRLAGSQGTGG